MISPRMPYLRGGRLQLSIRVFWLLFAQAATIMLAAFFVVSLIRPNLLGERHSEAGPESLERGLTISKALSRIAPSVVSVHAAGDYESGQDGHVASRGHNLGSGVIMSVDGLIVTNHHVIEGSDDIVVWTHSGQRLTASLVGADPMMDIAVLKVFADGPLPEAVFASTRKLRVGDFVVSIGSPHGLSGSASLGIVSATGRSGLGLARFEHFIQTDAAINYGSSGGALADVNGELVGINTALFSKRQAGMYTQGIGFAIPADLVRLAYEEIVDHGRFRRGWIGLVFNRPSGAVFAKDEMLYVSSVIPGSPGERAGVLQGDYVTAINGRAPSQIDIIEEASGKLMHPGEQVRLDIMRNGYEFSVSMIAGEQ